MASNSTAPPASNGAPTPTATTVPASPRPGPSSTATATPESPSPTVPRPSPPSSSAEAPSPDPPSSSAPPPSTTRAPPPTTATTTAPSRPPSTTVFTSIITSAATAPGESPTTIVVTITSAATISDPTSDAAAPSSSAADPTGAALPGTEEGNAPAGGLSTGGKTAIAVVVPVAVVALLVIAGILLWRRRKQQKKAEEARRNEVEEYGFNPNNDPTLPVVSMQADMAEGQSGYRGWGNATVSSGQKGSTTLASGITYSDSNSNPGDYQSPESPTAAQSDAYSGEALMNGRREAQELDGIGAPTAVPNIIQNPGHVHRGPSNASSSYSVADGSDNSGDYALPASNYDTNAYYQSSPYENNGYAGQQPIIRDVSARRNTRIENPSVFPQQANSGIAQNF